MGWDNDAPLSDVAAGSPSQNWGNDIPLATADGKIAGNPLAQPKSSSGIGTAIEAGYQSSIYGLASRGKLPDVQLDPHHSTWYERAAQGATQLALDFPAMVAGGAIGGAAGSAAPVVGNVVGAGAGAFAIPAAIREAYVQAYKNGEIESSADFLNRASIVLKTAAKEGIVGAVTGGLGKGLSAVAGKAGIGETGALIAGTAGEYGGLVVTPSVLEGRMPEMNDMVDAAVMLGGLKGVHYTAGKIADIYAKTGAHPENVMAAAQADPQIMDQLGVPPKITPEIQAWKDTSRTPFSSDATTSTELVDTLKNHLGEDHFASTLIDKLAPSLKDFKIEVIPDSEWKFKGYSQNQQARTDFGKGVIQFRDDIKPEPALHEVIHEATYNELQSNPEFKQSITAIMDSVRSAIQNGDVTGVPKPDLLRVKNALKNEAEFVAYGLSSPQVMNTLRGIKGDASSPTMFTKFVQTVSNGYGFGGKDYTALHDLIRAVDTGLEPKVEGEVSVAPEAAIPDAYQKVAVADAVDNATRPIKDAKPPEATFPELKEIPGTRTSIDFDITKINSIEELDEAMARHKAELQHQIDYQKGGRVSWDETTEKTIERLKLLGADHILAARDPYDPVNRLDLHAAVMFGEKAAADVTNIAGEMRKNGAVTQEGLEKLYAAQLKVAMILPNREGMASEAGRTLQIVQNTKFMADKAKLILEYMEKFKNDPEAMIDAILALEDPAKVAELSRKIVEPTTWQKITEYYRASLISGPTSMIANVLGTPLHMAVTPVVDALAVPVGVIARNPERVVAAEPIARVLGNLMGVRDGLRAVSIAVETGAKPGEKMEGRVNAIGGWQGSVVRSPFKVLAAGDAFFSAVLAHGEHYAMAAKQATKEGFDPLSREFREKVADLVANPSEAMLAAGEEAAKRFTYNNKLGSFGSAVQDAVRKGKLEWVMPFTQTPGNIAKEVTRLTPAGPLVDTWRADFAKGGAARDKAVAELLVGGAIGATVFSYAKGGSITGGGDFDPKKRQTQIASGWQPYSIKIGDKYYSYARMAPIGTVIGLYADLHEAWEHFSDDERDKSVKVLSMAVRNAITNQTFLAGLSNLVGALDEPENKAGKLFQNLAGSIVPSLVSQVNQRIDPYQREVNNMLDAIRARIPGAQKALPLPFMGEELQPRRNIVGEPIKQQARAFPYAPIATSTPSGDKVMGELARLGISTNKAPKDIVLSAMGDREIGKVALTPKQRDAYAETAGKFAHEILSSIVNDSGWSELSDFEQKKQVEEIFTKARDLAKKEALTPEQYDTEITRITDELDKRLNQRKKL